MAERLPVRLPVAWLLIAMAVLLRAAMPAGWMPVPHEGGLRIMLCTGNGPVAMRLDTGGSDDGAGQTVDRRDPCPFGLSLGSPGELPSPFGTPVHFAAQALGPTAMAAARLVAWRALRPPARGPPALA